MCVELPKRYQAAYEVAPELCLLSRDIIYKPVPVDVASTLELNHVKSTGASLRDQYDITFVHIGGLKIKKL